MIRICLPIEIISTNSIVYIVSSTFRYIKSVIPIGAMFALTLWLGNSAYLYISVAFAQMLKAISNFHLLFFILQQKELPMLLCFALHFVGTK